MSPAVGILPIPEAVEGKIHAQGLLTAIKEWESRGDSPEAIASALERSYPEVIVQATVPVMTEQSRAWYEARVEQERRSREAVVADRDALAEALAAARAEVTRLEGRNARLWAELQASDERLQRCELMNALRVGPSMPRGLRFWRR